MRPPDFRGAVMRLTAGRTKVYYKNPPPNRRHTFRDTQCARQTFMCGGVSAAGRTEVYCAASEDSEEETDVPDTSEKGSNGSMVCVPLPLSMMTLRPGSSSSIVS